jgi:hypothetical protein
MGNVTGGIVTPIVAMTTEGQDFQDNAIAQFQAVLANPNVQPAEVVAAAAKLKINLSTAQAMFDAAGKTGDFYRDVVSQAVR